MRDLAYLLAAFEESLQGADVVDPPEVLRRATRACAEEDGTRHDLLGLPTLLLDHTPTSGAETELLCAVFAHSPDVLATLCAGDDEGLSALRPLLGTEDTLDDGLEDHSLEDHGLEDHGLLNQGARLPRLRRRIFRDLSEEASEPASEAKDAGVDEDRQEEPADDSFAFFAAAGEGREAVEIARKHPAISASGLPFDASPSPCAIPLTYLPLVEEALHRARIPAYFSRGTVRPDPAGRAFLALLACADEHCRRRASPST